MHPGLRPQVPPASGRRAAVVRNNREGPATAAPGATRQPEAGGETGGTVPEGRPRPAEERQETGTRARTGRSANLRRTGQAGHRHAPPLAVRLVEPLAFEKTTRPGLSTVSAVSASPVVTVPDTPSWLNARLPEPSAAASGIWL